MAGEKFCKEGLEVLGDNEMSMGQQSALAATASPSIPGCMNGSTGRRRAMFPLYSALHPVLPPAPDVNKLEQTWKAKKMVRAYSTSPVKGNMRVLSLFTLDKRQLRGI